MGAFIVIVHPFFPEVKRVISLPVDIERKLYQSRSSVARSMSSDQQFSVKREKNNRANSLAFIIDEISMRRCSVPFFVVEHSVKWVT